MWSPGASLSPEYALFRFAGRIYQILSPIKLHKTACRGLLLFLVAYIPTCVFHVRRFHKLKPRYKSGMVINCQQQQRLSCSIVESISSDTLCITCGLLLLSSSRYPFNHRYTVLTTTPTCSATYSILYCPTFFNAQSRFLYFRSFSLFAFFHILSLLLTHVGV